MTTYVALFRGINVGGSNILPMKELTAVLVDIGLGNVRTYIQSGNVVFQSTGTDTKELAQAIRTAVGKSHGFEPEVLVLSVGELRDAISGCPYLDGDPDPKTNHILFLESPPTNPDIDRLDACKSASEQFLLDGAAFYLLAPEGIGRSKLAAKAEKALGVTATGRNWRTVIKLMSMAEALEGS